MYSQSDQKEHDRLYDKYKGRLRAKVVVSLGEFTSSADDPFYARLEVMRLMEEDGDGVASGSPDKP